MADTEPCLESCVEQGVLVLTVARRQIEGELIAQQLQEELRAAVARSGLYQVVLDMKNTRYVSSVAFWPLLALRRLLHEHGGRMVLCGLTGTVEEVFVSTRMVSSSGSLNAPFELAPTRADAVARLAVPV